VDDLRRSLLRGDLVQDVRRLHHAGAEDHGHWLRENFRHALTVRRQDAVAVSALTGLAPGTVRGFLNGRPSSINNVLLMAEAVGFTVADLDRPPEEFRAYARAGQDGTEGGAIGASLLAFDEAPLAMAIILLDGTIVKANRRLRELLGFDEGELIGANEASFFAVTSEEVRAERNQELMTTGVTRGRVDTLRRKDGSSVNVVTSAILVNDQDGQPRYVIARAAPAEAGRAAT
jgi:PAS domain S-box-containing protein